MTGVRSIGMKPSELWFGYAGAFIANAIVLGMLSGFTSALTLKAAILPMTGAFVCAVLFIIAGRRDVDERWLHLGPIGSFALYIMSGMAVTSGSFAAFAVLLITVMLGPASFMGLRFAAPHIAFGLIAIVGIVLIDDHPFAVGRATALVAITLVMAAQILYSRQRVRELVLVNRRLAEIDPLTGIANARYFNRRLHEEILRSERTGDDIAVFSLDLDNFKRINDELSHTTGDNVLKAVAAAIDEVLSSGELVSRRGGDEFLVLAPAVGDGAERLRGQMASAVTAARREIAPAISPTASIGCVIRQAGEDAESLIARADRELHESKLDAHPERRAGLAEVRRFPIPSRPATERIEQAVGRAGDLAQQEDEWDAESTALQGRALWIFGAIGTGVLGSVGLAITAANGVDAIQSYLAFAAIVCLAGLCVLAGHSGAKPVVIATITATSIAFLTVGIAYAGEAGSALVDFYLLPALFAYFALPLERRSMLLVALGTMGICMTLHGLLLQATDAPWSELRTFIAVQIAVVDSTANIRGKHSTRRLAALNRSLSGFDSLTGLANLRIFNERMRTEVERATQIGRPFGLVMIDLDEFKQVNDQFDHSVGDRVLVATARAISSCAREDELVARRGGDEFAIVTGPIEPADLSDFTDRVAKMIARARLAICPDLTPTASVAYAVWRDGDDADAIVERADNALHEAKVLHHMGDLPASVDPRSLSFT